MSPASDTNFFITNSAMGERQMLPWQMNSILIKSLSPSKRRFPADICSVLRGVNFSLCTGHFCTYNANLSKILQDEYSKHSRNVVKSGWGYYYSYPLCHTVNCFKKYAMNKILNSFTICIHALSIFLFFQIHHGQRLTGHFFPISRILQFVICYNILLYLQFLAL